MPRSSYCGVATIPFVKCFSTFRAKSSASVLSKFLWINIVILYHGEKLNQLNSAKFNYNNYNLLSNIKERGPDNFSIYDTRNILLIHSRLAIQNTGITELQPYQYNNNILCFNGEIYNTKYLADKYKLDYNIDTDLICKLYESNKSNFVNIIKEFDGIFAFMI